MATDADAAARGLDDSTVSETLAALPGYLSVFEAVRAPDGSVADLRLLLANDSLAKLLGGSPAALRGRSYRELADPGDQESYEFRLATLADGLPRTRERFSTTVGRWLRVSYFPVAPDVVGAHSIDVTAEVNADAALEAARRESREAQRVAGVGSWYFDLATGTPTWTEQLLRMHGLGPADRPPRVAEMAGYYSTEASERFSALMERAARDGTPYEYQTEVNRPDGSTIIMLARGEAVRDSAGRITALRGTASDVTERAAIQARLDDLQAELAAVSRRLVLGEVASSLAHELNQPLAAILSSAETASRLIRDREHSCEEIAEILGDIAAQTDRAADVIRRLRSQLRRDPPCPEELDLNQLVREALRLTATEARHRGATATLDLSEPLPLVFGDRVQLQQVLINLLLNALDAVEKGPPPRKATIRTWTEAGRVSLSVSDSGPGIPVDHLEKVFEPFYSTKPDGLGVGLPLSRSLAEAHAGTLRAGNAPGAGAVFVLTLPATPSRDGKEGSAG